MSASLDPPPPRNTGTSGRLPSAAAEIPSKAAAQLRCRPIAADDIEAVVDLLTRGFRERAAAYWRDGLARQAARTLPDGCPRFGYVLAAGDRLVGVVLTLYAASRDPNGSGAWCNLSSWYVEPAYRPYATLLDRMALKREGTTFTNISPAPHTVPMHEARGFRPVARGQIAVVPILGRRQPGISACTVDPGDALDDLSAWERRLVLDHAGYGCVALLGRDARGRQPFVFIRHPIQAVKWRLGFSPVHYMQLVYCRATAELPRFARALGRELLVRHGATCMVVDADAPIPGLVGRYREGRGVRLKRGPDIVRPGDLAYSELVIFGP